MKKLTILLGILIVALLAAGAAGVSIAASRVSREAQASLLRQESLLTQNSQKKTLTNLNKKYRKRSSAQRLMAQLIVPPPILNPLTLCMSTPVEKPEYKGEVITKATKVHIESGGEAEVALFIKNTGNTPWFGDSSGCTGVPYTRLGTAREQDRGSLLFHPADVRWLGQNRIVMVEPKVEPGEIATFRFAAKAPDTTDIFREYFQPVIEGKTWISTKEATAEVDAYIGGFPHEMHEAALKFLNRSGQASTLDVDAKISVDVDISEQKIRVYLGNAIIREYTVSTGTFKTPTPLGRFKILNKQELRIGAKKPHYRMPKWQGFTQWGHGFHSLPYLADDEGIFWEEALTHIGQRVSHGCIRLLPEDSEDLYEITDVGTPIVIHN